MPTHKTQGEICYDMVYHYAQLTIFESNYILKPSQFKSVKYPPRYTITVKITTQLIGQLSKYTGRIIHISPYMYAYMTEPTFTP